MVYRKPSYEEYCKATEFARIRYKFGVYVQIFAIILFLLVIIYVVINIEEMKANPINYAEKKMNVICYPTFNGMPVNIQNGNDRYIEGIEEG